MLVLNYTLKTGDTPALLWLLLRRHNFFCTFNSSLDPSQKTKKLSFFSNLVFTPLFFQWQVIVFKKNLIWYLLLYWRIYIYCNFWYTWKDIYHLMFFPPPSMFSLLCLHFHLLFYFPLLITSCILRWYICLLKSTINIFTTF